MASQLHLCSATSAPCCFLHMLSTLLLRTSALAIFCAWKVIYPRLDIHLNCYLTSLKSLLRGPCHRALPAHSITRQPLVTVLLYFPHMTSLSTECPTCRDAESLSSVSPSRRSDDGDWSEVFVVTQLSVRRVLGSKPHALLDQRQWSRAQRARYMCGIRWAIVAPGTHRSRWEHSIKCVTSRSSCGNLFSSSSRERDHRGGCRYHPRLAGPRPIVFVVFVPWECLLEIPKKKYAHSRAVPSGKPRSCGFPPGICSPLPSSCANIVSNQASFLP